MTQPSVILEHLHVHGSITSRDAIRMYGITRLAAQIAVLKRKGIKIRTVTEVGDTKYGTVHYARYYIVEDDKNASNAYS